MVEEVQDILRAQNEIPGNSSVRSLCRSLKRLRSLLAELEGVVAYQSTAVKGKAYKVTLDRSVWLRLEHKVYKIMENIGGAKVDLSCAMAILNVYVSTSKLMSIRRANSASSLSTHVISANVHNRGPELALQTVNQQTALTKPQPSPRHYGDRAIQLHAVHTSVASLRCDPSCSCACHR